MHFKNNADAAIAQQQQTNALIQAARRGRSSQRRQRRRFLICSMAEIEEQPWSAAQEDIRAIGKRLFFEGGRTLMLRVWRQIKDARDAKQVEIAWEKIGGWYR